jgi:single-strand DNA-binding protein
MNKVILSGFTGKEVEVKTFEDGRKVANVSLATNESYKNKQGERVDKTDWHNLVAWSPLADVWEKHLKKGSRIEIVGKIETRSYESNNEKRYVTEIKVNEFNFTGSKPTGDISPERDKNEAIASDEWEGLPF